MDGAWTWLIDGILLLVLIEALLLWWRQRQAPRRDRLASQLTLASGAGLMLALRAAIVDSSSGLLLALALALVAHAAWLFISLPARS
ncbi:MAG: hypothetical protein RIC56_09435 [Pseudomonadales bacterium]